MTDETIVAVFDTAEHAANAVRDLEAAGVPSSAITQHGTAFRTAGTEAEPREGGFWSGLFGGEPEHRHDTTVYDRSLSGGSTVVTVRASEQYVAHTMEILERHGPVDIDERAAGYSAMAMNSPETAPLAAGSAASLQANPGVTGVHGGTPEEETLSLSEEQLAVGKRAVNRGTTRVRRYVVETPVQEDVTLREETVSVARRPVSEQRPVTGADFTDRVIDVTQTAEEAVVAKVARVREEVVIRKSATERTETVSDTVRREDVEVTKQRAAGPQV